MTDLESREEVWAAWTPGGISAEKVLEACDGVSLHSQGGRKQDQHLHRRLERRRGWRGNGRSRREMGQEGGVAGGSHAARGQVR